MVLVEKEVKFNKLLNPALLKDIQLTIHVLRHLSLVLFWDIRPPKNAAASSAPPTSNTPNKAAAASPSPYKFLDLTWKPHLRVSLYHVFSY